MGKERKFFITEECQLINVEEMKDRKPLISNHHSYNYLRQELRMLKLVGKSLMRNLLIIWGKIEFHNGEPG